MALFTQTKLDEDRIVPSSSVNNMIGLIHTTTYLQQCRYLNLNLIAEALLSTLLRI